MKSFRELKRYLQEGGLKTSRAFLPKPHSAIKLCDFFSSESHKTFHGDCASEEQSLSFPLELVGFLSPGPFPKDHCIHPFAGEVSSWVRIYLGLNKPGLKTTITASQMTHWALQTLLEIPSLAAEPALAAAEAQQICRLCAGRSNAALCRSTISPVPYKSCVLCFWWKHPVANPVEWEGSCCLPPFLLNWPRQNSALNLCSFKGCRDRSHIGGKGQSRGERASHTAFLLLNALQSGGQDNPLGNIPWCLILYWPSAYCLRTHYTTFSLYLLCFPFHLLLIYCSLAWLHIVLLTVFQPESAPSNTEKDFS